MKTLYSCGLMMNEQGYNEVTIEYERTFIDWLLGRDSALEKYIMVNGSWYDKSNFRKPSASKVIEICDIYTACTVDFKRIGI